MTKQKTTTTNYRRVDEEIQGVFTNLKQARRGLEKITRLLGQDYDDTTLMVPHLQQIVSDMEDRVEELRVEFNMNEDINDGAAAIDMLKTMISEIYHN